MILPVFHQGGLFLGMIAAGVFFAFIYDLFRVARRIVVHSSLFIHLEDLIFWLIVIAAVFGFLLILNSGELRFFAIAGFFSGMIIYFILISPVFLMFSMTLYGIIKSIVLLLYSIVSAPIKAFFGILAYPAGIAAGKAQELYRYERRLYTGVKIRGKHRARKMKNDLRIVFKKI